MGRFMFLHIFSLKEDFLMKIQVIIIFHFIFPTITAATSTVSAVTKGKQSSLWVECTEMMLDS